MKLSGTSKNLMIGVVLFCAIGLAVGVFFAPRLGFYTAGVVLGCVMSLVKIFLLERAVNKAIKTEDSAKAANAMRLGYMSRYLITAAVLFAAAFTMQLSGLVGTLVGAVALTLSAYGAKLFPKKGEDVP